ncbi:MAG: FHA domain-containing protein, partial [Candidatus Eisenbacteria bacterium]
MAGAQLIKLRLSLMGRPVRNYTFDKPVIQVGRDPAADVYVDNPGVSRDHFRLAHGRAAERARVGGWSDR